MLRTDRVFAILIVCASVLATACGSPSLSAPRSCTGDEACDPSARCVSHSCMENALPTAAFTVSGDLVASAPITLDASTSSDPDEGDTLSSYQWSVSSTDAACEPPVIAGTAKTAQVRFGCSGHWDVKLIVFDGKQAQSPPTIHTLAIAERTGPALVTAGEDLTVGHVCAGSPTSCTTDGEVQLSATLNSEATLTVRWTVQAPAGLPLDDTRRVRFDPSDTAPNPKAVIETNGTAISGDWVFRVEALNGDDVLDYDTMRVSVTNRAPVVSVASTLTVPHTCLASSGFFTANGSTPLSIADPDGDPVTRTMSVHHSGDGEAVFQATDNETALGITILVPLLHPEWLISPTDLSRTVSVNATDSNGSTAASATVTVTVGNSPPQALYVGSTAPHTYSSATQAYVASPILGRWQDPDGDPLDQQATMTDANAADCPTTSLLSDGTIQANCSRRFDSLTDLASFTRSRSAQVTVSDPWSSVARTGIPFSITNRAPTMRSGLTTTVSVGCRMGANTCSQSTTSGTPSTLYSSGTSSFILSALTDPDGDPLQVTPDPSIPGGAGGTCVGSSSCKLTFGVTGGDVCEMPAQTIGFTATDGAAPVTLSIAAQPVCK